MYQKDNLKRLRREEAETPNRSIMNKETVFIIKKHTIKEKPSTR